MSDPPLKLAIDGDTVRVVGDVDMSTCGQLDEILSTLDSAGLAFVDLSAVTFMDSSGLRVLITHHMLRSEQHCRLTILDPSETVRRLFQITKVDEEFHVETPSPSGNSSTSQNEQ